MCFIVTDLPEIVIGLAAVFGSLVVLLGFTTFVAIILLRLALRHQQIGNGNKIA